MLISLKNTFYGVNRKTVLIIELVLAIMRINETMKIMGKEDNCLVVDPWRFDFSNLRKNAITC